MRDAIAETVDAGIGVAVVAAELVPAHDALWFANYARANGTWLIGPNTVGISSPWKCLLGSIPVEFTKPGRVGVISRSGTMGSWYRVFSLRPAVVKSTVACIGGDAVASRLPHEYLDTVFYIGEIGGLKEYEMLDRISHSTKQVAAMIVGRSAPPGKRMGHAGALIGEEREKGGGQAGRLANGRSDNYRQLSPPAVVGPIARICARINTRVPYHVSYHRLTNRPDGQYHPIDRRRR